MNRTIGRLIALGLFCALGLAGQAAHSQVLTWTGSAGATWNTTNTNWSTVGVGTPWDSTNGPSFVADFATTGASAQINGSPAAIFANGLQFDSTGTVSGGSINLVTGTLPTPTITVNASSGTIGSVLVGASGLIKSGSGALYLGAASPGFTGGTTISQGTLQLNAANAAGPGSQLITLGDANTGANNIQLTVNNASVANSVTVSSSAGGTSTISYIPTTASISMGTLTLNGPATFSAPNLNGTVVPGAGVFVLSGSGQLNIATTHSQRLLLQSLSPNYTGNIVVQSSSIFEPRAELSSTNGNNITVNSGGELRIQFVTTSIAGLNGAGTVDDVSGAATLSVGAGNASGTFSGTLKNNGNTLSFTKTGNGTQVLSGGNIGTLGPTTLTQGTLNLTNAPNFTGALTMNAANTVDLQLGSTGSSSWTLGQQINGGSTNAIIEKIGPGTVVLSPSAGSTFVGSSTAALTVTQGSLFLTNPFNTDPAVFVGPLGAFGGATTAGPTTVATGGGIVGGFGGAGQLTLASLAYVGTGSLQGTLATGVTPIVVTGAVTTSGSNTIAVSAANLPANGLYNLLSYGSGADPFGAFKLASPSRSISLVDNSGSQLIQLNVNLNTYPIWTGLASGDWSLNTEPNPKNWRVNTGGATDFLTNDAVVFDDSVGTAGTTNVTLNNGNVNPGAMTFNNSLYNYTLSGTAGITTGSLALNGSASVTINTANSFGGGTTLSAGTLVVGNNTALGSGTLGINGGWLQATGGAIALSNSVVATTTLQVYADANSLALSGPVTGIDLLKSGTGMLTLGAATNNFSGNLTISQGTLQVNSTGPSSGAINLGDANTGASNVQLNIAAPVANAITVSSAGPGSATINALGNIASFNNAITVNGPLTITGTGAPSNPAPTFSLTGSGTVTFSVPTTGQLIPMGDASGFTGDVVVASPTVFEPRSFLSNFNGNNVTVMSGGTLQIISFGATSINALNGNGVVQGRFAPGSLTIGIGNGSGTFSGTMQNNGQAWTLTKTGTGTEELVGAGIAYTAATTLTNGTLRLTNATAWASPVTLDFFNTVDLQLNNTSGTALTFGQQINGGSTNAIIEKLGPGTVVLSPAAGSTFQSSGSGALTVTAGALYLTNTNLSTFGNPAVALATGGTFGGNSTVGAVTVAAGGGIVGGFSGAGALTMNSLTFSGTGTIAGALNAGAPPIVVNGSVTANPASIAVSPTNLPADGTYPFLSYTGTDPFSDFTLSSSVIGRTVLTLVDSSASDLIALTLTTSAYPIWTGKASGDWSLATEPNPKNWRLNTGGAATDFLSGDTVMFDDSVGTAGTTNVTLNNGNVTPGSTTFNNSLYNYTLSGTAGITTGALTKNGTGTLTINTANSFTGGATLNAGTLVAGNNSALGGGGLLINGGWLQPGGGTIALPNNVTVGGDFAVGADVNSLTLNGAVSLNTPSGTATITVNGTGGVMFANTVTGNYLVKSGTGTLALGAPNNFAGGVTLSQGTLQLNADGAAGGAPITLGDANTGGNNLLLAVNSSSAASDITVANQGTGSVTLSITPTTSVINWGSASNTITLNRAATLTAPVETSYLEFNQALSGSGELDIGSTNAAQGGWIILFTQSPGFTGNVVIGNNAVLEPRDILSAFNGNNVTVQSGGTLQLISFGATAIAGLSGNGDIRARFAGTTLTVGEGDASSTFSGTMEDGQASWNLDKTGSGTLVLTGAPVGGIPTATSSFTGNVTVDNGTLVAAAVASGGSSVLGGASNSRTITVNSGATLLFVVPNALGTGFNATNVPTLAINGGTVTNADPGSPFPAGFINNALNNVNLTDGVLTATTGQHGGYAAWNINGTVTSSGQSLISTSDPVYGTVMLNSTGSDNTTFNVTDGTLTVSAPLVQDNVDNVVSGLTLTGGGTMVLSATNTYQGGTTVADGTLIVVNSEAIADGTSLTVGDPSQFSPAPVVPAAAVASAAAITPVPEPGTLALIAAAALAGAGIWRKKGRKA